MKIQIITKYSITDMIYFSFSPIVLPSINRAAIEYGPLVTWNTGSAWYATMGRRPIVFMVVLSWTRVQIELITKFNNCIHIKKQISTLKSTVVTIILQFTEPELVLIFKIVLY